MRSLNGQGVAVHLTVRLSHVPSLHVDGTGQVWPALVKLHEEPLATLLPAEQLVSVETARRPQRGQVTVRSENGQGSPVTTPQDASLTVSQTPAALQARVM